LLPGYPDEVRVLVTGANGFVGGYVCRALIGAGWQVTGLSRRSDAKLPTGVTALEGDVASGDGLGRAMTGIDAVVHLVGIIQERGSQTFERVHVEGTRNVLEAATAAGVSRLVHMSALGAGLDSGSGYQRTKARTEELVRASGLAWTIIRPSLIFGVGDDFFGGTLRQLVKLSPVVPVVGRGDYPFRPVFIGDVATAFLRALERPEASAQAFDLVGPKEYTLRELLLLVRGALGSKKPLVNVPLPLMRVGVALFGLLPAPPITRDQFLMLLAGNTGDPRPAVAAFGLALEPLEDHLGEILGAAAAR